MKKLFSLLLILLLTFSLAACRRGEDNGEEDAYPEITGLSDREINVGEVITDWLVGVEATCPVDGDLTNAIDIDTSDVDIYSEGTYTVVYSVENSLENVTTEEITVTVSAEEVDTAPELHGIRDHIVELDDTEYDFYQNVSAEDETDGDLTDEIEIDFGDYDVHTEGTYTISYRVENSLGLVTEEEASVRVMEISYQLENGDFETGDLTGFETEGDAFSEEGIVDQDTYWDLDVPFDHEGTYHFRGYETGESATGTMRSSPFEIGGSGIVSMLLGAGKNSDLLYASIRHLRTDEELARLSNERFDFIDFDHPFDYAENYARYYADLSEHLGEYAYIMFVDEDDGEGDFNFLNIDDIVTYYEDDPRTPDSLLNPDFSTGDLDGWTLEGDFDEGLIAEDGEDGYYLSTPENQQGRAVSNDFYLLEDFVSFRVQGDADTRVDIVNAMTDEVLESIPGHVYEAFDRYLLDVSLYQGLEVRIEIVDESEEGSIAIDDFVLLSEDLEELDSMPLDIVNPGFETGDLFGWRLSGGAFGDTGVTDASLFWEADEENRFNHVGTYHFYGHLMGEEEVGSMRSTYFRVEEDSHLSLLLGAAADRDSLFVQIKDAETNRALKTITNEAFDFESFDEEYQYANNYARYYVDLSEFAGQVVYLDAIDLDRGDDFAFLNVDDIRIRQGATIEVPESLEFSMTPHPIEWENYVHVYGHEGFVIDDSEFDIAEGGEQSVDVIVDTAEGEVVETITVTITDDSPPSITGAEDRLTLIGDALSEEELKEGVEAYDALGETIALMIDSESFDAIDFDTVGVYTLTYYAIAPNGLETTETIEVEVIDPDTTPENADFETGDLTGWITEGDAFGDEGVTDQPTYWEEEHPFYHQGDYHFHGLLLGEESTGRMRSDYFRLYEEGSGYVSFLLGAGYAGSGDLRVKIVDAFTGEMLETVYNEHMDADRYIRYYVDLSEHRGEVLYFEIVDEDDRDEGFAYFNLDDFQTVYETAPTLEVDLPETIEATRYETIDWSEHLITHDNLPSSAVATIDDPFSTDEAGSFTDTITFEYSSLEISLTVTLEVEELPNTPENANFETGDLTGWETTGDAFEDAGVIDRSTFWDERPLHHEGTYHFKGNMVAAGETGNGTMRSTTFLLEGSGYVSFLLGAAPHEDTHVRFVLAESDEEIIRVHNEKFADPEYSNNYIRHYADLSEHLGEALYIEVVDESDEEEDFSYINVDDFQTYYEEAPELLVDIEEPIVVGEGAETIDWIDWLDISPNYRQTDELNDLSIDVDEGDLDTDSPGTYTVEITMTFVNGVSGLETISETRSATVEVDPEGPAHPYEIENPGFETGDLTGWTTEGDAFTDEGVIDRSTFWDDRPLHHEGDYHFKGNMVEAGEDGTGTMRSSTFTVGGAGYASFLMGSAQHEDYTYVRFVLAETDEEIVRVHNEKFDDPDYSNNYVRYYVDLSEHLGEAVYIEAVDHSGDAGLPWSFMNLDDFRTYYEEAPRVDVTVPETLTLRQYDPIPDWQNHIDEVSPNYPYGFSGDLSLDVDATDLETDEVGAYTVTLTVTYENGVDGLEEVTTTFTLSVTVEEIENDIVNGSFETGDLTGWHVTEGDAFCEAGVTDEATFWDEANPFNHYGTYHFYGYRCGETTTGRMRSSQFVLGGSGYVSMLLGAGMDTERTYVRIMNGETGDEVARLSNDAFDGDEYTNNYARQYADLSEHIGERLYIEVVDENDEAGFGFLNIDDVVTYYEDEPTGGDS